MLFVEYSVITSCVILAPLTEKLKTLLLRLRSLILNTSENIKS